MPLPDFPKRKSVLKYCTPRWEGKVSFQALKKLYISVLDGNLTNLLGDG